MIDKLFVVTSNQGKVISFQKALSLLNIKVEQLDLQLFEPQFNTIEEIAIFKAKEAFKIAKRPLVINDSGLVISALKGFPGPYTKYVFNTLTCDDILNLLEKHSNRNCYLHQVIVFVDEKGLLHIFQDKIEGSISTYVASVDNPRAWGELWKIFVPKTSFLTLSEITEEDYEIIRSKAQISSVWNDLKDFLLREEEGNRCIQ